MPAALDIPRWAVMWGLAVAIFIACKLLTWGRVAAPHASVARQAGYLLAWPGLDAPTFLATPATPPPAPPTAWEWSFAAAKMAVGVVLLYGLARRLPDGSPLLVGWVGMIGLVFVLHFGLFHLLSCGWRALGVDARPLMHWPILATSLSDFWGRRWNTAFRDLTHRFLFRPLIARVGPAPAVLVGFLFSGIVHDAVISLPARGGLGGPTLFFLIQGMGLLVERSRPARRLGLTRGLPGRLFTLALLILPFMHDIAAL